jgi:hypothetical protein
MRLTCDSDRWLIGSFSLAGDVLFADVLLLPNGMSKVGAYT